MMVDINALDIDELEQLRDACNRRLLQMRRTQNVSLAELLRLLEEVRSTLRDQHKEWYSLERWQWMDGEIRFWLNPKDQDLYRSGWFSIDDLIAWTQDVGSIMIEEELEEELDERPSERIGGVTITWLPGGRDDKPTPGREDALINVM